MFRCCFAANQTKVYASGLEEEHWAALKAAEALLAANAESKVADLYVLSAPVGHGAFAKVVECTHKAGSLLTTASAYWMLAHTLTAMKAVQHRSIGSLQPAGVPAVPMSVIAACCIHLVAEHACLLAHSNPAMCMQATGNKYACKILPGKTSQGDRRSKIIHEIAVMQRLGKHPYTLAFHDAYHSDGNYYLIMELCTGAELFDQIVQKVSPCLPHMPSCRHVCTGFISFLLCSACHPAPDVPRPPL